MIVLFLILGVSLTVALAERALRERDWSVLAACLMVFAVGMAAIYFVIN
jgi:hypothetical protein